MKADQPAPLSLVPQPSAFSLQTFYEKFDLFSDAPGAVATMRELVLELAVQGKLVRQDPNDAPAEEFLRQIELVRSHIGKNANGKRPAMQLPVESDNAPFEIPPGWAWCRLGTLGLIGSSCRVHEKDWTTSGVPFLRAREIVKLSKSGKVDNDLFINEEHYQRLASEGLTPEPNDIMITGVGTIGVPYIVSDSDRFYFKDASVLILKNCFGLYPHYLHIVMQSPYWIREVHRESMGTTVHTLTIVRAKQTPIPLPPLAEQKRIVAKVDELVALCDRLEAQQQERETRYAALARAALARFADAPTPANLDFLFHSSFSIQPSDLRKSILTLAVQGKLVPQDPNDEPAEVFLGQIAQRLGKSKVRRSTNNGAPITDEANPFELPPGWAWSHFPELGEFGRGKSKHRPRNDRSLFIGGNHPLVQTGDVARANGTIETHTGCYNDVGLAQSKMWPAGTLCITIAANIADSGILGFDACFPDSVVGFIPAQPIQSVRYFEYFMRTAKEHLEQFAPATAQKNINLGILEQVWIPIPPLAEQRRIVAKVEQLMALVDALETQLAASRATAANLLSALVSELTAQV